MGGAGRPKRRTMSSGRRGAHRSSAIYHVETHEKQPFRFSSLICKLELTAQLRVQLLSTISLPNRVPFPGGWPPLSRASRGGIPGPVLPGGAFSTPGSAWHPRSRDLATFPGLVCGHLMPGERNSLGFISLHCWPRATARVSQPMLPGASWFLPLSPTFEVASFFNKLPLRLARADFLFLIFKQSFLIQGPASKGHCEN